MPNRPSGKEAGSALLTVTVILMISLAMVLATLTTTNAKSRDAYSGVLELRAHYLAKSGVERQIHQVWTARNLADLADPFAGLDTLDSDVDEGEGHYTQTFDAEPVVNAQGETIGEFDVVIDVTNRAELQTRNVVITAIGYAPTKADFLANANGSSTATVKAVIEVGLEPSTVFDYSYFINHWGWFYGDTIEANGNVRANGQFDFGGYSPQVNGSPRYETANGTDLIGYIDDNGDGVEDGTDGGVYAGWGIVNEQNVQGMGGDVENQHGWQEQIPMPNLSDLSVYEALAISEGGTISVGGTTIVSGVVGDDPSEPQNLYLEGTVADPIVIDGPVVVRGDVIVRGVVTGQGTIYSGRNAYVPENLTYADGPTTDRPSANDELTVEQWRIDNADKDALGLFAREHVVIGDYSDFYFQHYVGNWLASSLNKSAEDAGADGIHNTANGPDGIAGTSDDDVLEGDGEWTVDLYTQADADQGLIPAGSAIGDPIPGTGEDLDGDGVYDGQVQMTEFEISQSLDPANWAGLDTTYANFSDISTIYISQIDGSFYTNHVFAALMFNFGGLIEMNGSIVSRNESIVYGANGIHMNHDERLTGGGGASTFGLFLPVSWAPIEVLQWQTAIGERVDGYVTVAP